MPTVESIFRYFAWWSVDLLACGRPLPFQFNQRSSFSLLILSLSSPLARTHTFHANSMVVRKNSCHDFWLFDLGLHSFICDDDWLKAGKWMNLTFFNILFPHNILIFWLHFQLSQHFYFFIRAKKLAFLFVYYMYLSWFRMCVPIFVWAGNEGRTQITNWKESGRQNWAKIGSNIL